MGYQRLSFSEREEIAVGLAASESLATIAKRVGRHRSTVSREVRRHSLRSQGYRASVAQRQSDKHAKRPKRRKLARFGRLRWMVESRLLKRWSPKQISVNLRRMSDKPQRNISAETIYQSLYVQGRGTLRKQLHQALRRGRAYRRSQSSVKTGTLVERRSRYVMLVHLPTDRQAHTVAHAIKKRIAHLPTQLKRTLTWDQGREMAQHRWLAKTTGLQIYFCDPHGPWQRGSNENTNGLLRQYLPKDSDLSTLSQTQLNRIARELNTRPRETLDWMTPAQYFHRRVALAT